MKKKQFSCQNFQKLYKNGTFECFFKNLTAAQSSLAQNRFSIVFLERSENDFIRPVKNRLHFT